jgi:LuxR family maltose regulon positive regulatory protein
VEAIAHGQQRQEAARAGLAWIRIKALEQALALAEPESDIRIFIDEGAPMAALLRQAATCGSGPGQVTTLLAAFGDQRPQA